MSSSDKFICNKGFILTPSEDNEEVMVPFFIKVRDKDIIWSDDDFPSIINDIVKSNPECVSLSPVKELKCKYNGWNIVFQQDYTYTASTMISIIGSGYFTMNEKCDLLQGNVELPFKSKSGADNISIICTLDAYDETMMSSIVTTSLDFSTTAISSFKVNIKNATGTYPFRYRLSDSLNKSYLNISVRGKYVD